MKQMLLAAGLLVSIVASAQSWETKQAHVFRPLDSDVGPQTATQADAGSEIDLRDYRFRGDPALPGEDWRTPDGQEVYRFRPLSEQEKARLEQTQERRN